jgi:hypothetical protein
VKIKHPLNLTPIKETTSAYLTNPQVYYIYSYILIKTYFTSIIFNLTLKMAPLSLRPRGYNGRFRETTSDRGFPQASVIPKNKKKNSKTQSINDQSSVNSSTGGEIRKILLQNEREQSVAQGREEQEQLQSYSSPFKILPGGLPCYGPTPRRGIGSQENQRLGSQNFDGRNVFSTPRTRSHQKRSESLPPKSSQKQKLETPKECKQKQRMEEPNLPRDDQDGALSPRVLSTSGKREDSPSTAKTDGYEPRRSVPILNTPNITSRNNSPTNDSQYRNLNLAFDLYIKNINQISKQCVEMNQKVYDEMRILCHKIQNGVNYMSDEQDNALAVILETIDKLRSEPLNLEVIVPQISNAIKQDFQTSLDNLEFSVTEKEEDLRAIRRHMNVMEVKMDNNIKESIARINSQHTTYETTINRIETNIAHLVNIQRKADENITKLTRTIEEHIRKTPSPEIFSPTPPLQGNSRKIPQMPKDHQEGTTSPINKQPCNNNRGSDSLATDRNSSNNTESNNEDKSLAKLILASLPKTSDWATFSGTGEYDHFKFIDWIDNIKEDTKAPDQIICSRLTSILTGVANTWFTSRKKEVGADKSWEFWKEEIIKKFSTPEWKRKVKIAFRKDRFDVSGEKEPCDWVVNPPSGWVHKPFTQMSHPPF